MSPILLQLLLENLIYFLCMTTPLATAIKRLLLQVQVQIPVVQVPVANDPQTDQNQLTLLMPTIQKATDLPMLNSWNRFAREAQLTQQPTSAMPITVLGTWYSATGARIV